MNGRLQRNFSQICYSGMDRNAFRLLEEQINKQNYQFILRVDIFAASQLIVILLSNLVTSYVSMMIPVCLAFLGVYFVEYALRFLFLRKREAGRVTLRMWYCMSKFFLFSLFSSVIYNLESTAFSFFIFLIALPLLFIRPTWQMTLYITAISILFGVAVKCLKPAELATADLYYLFICFIFSNCITYWVNSMRLRSIKSEYLLTIQRDTDVLTGLYNRLCFNNYITRTWKINQKINIMVMDVDYFKSYNDHYGHLMGDDILRALGDLFLKFSERNELFCARYGGEEFVVVDLGNSRRMEALTDELLAEVRELSLAHEFADCGKITISIGCACQEQVKAVSYIDLLNCADKALYLAKQEGRDCAVIWNEH